MSKQLLFSIISVVLLAGCTQESPQINAVCDLMPNGLFLIKWETFPPIDGTVRGYESNFPDSFNMNVPVFEQKIETGYQRVLTRTYDRTYFKLVFNKRHSTVVSERKLPMQGILNFRDLGGYYTQDKRQIKWGKIYHSSALSSVTPYDRSILKKLHIETIIDFRTERERDHAPNNFQAAQMYNWPLRGNRHNFYFDEILSQRVQAETILVYDRNNFGFLWENNSDYFIKMFDMLTDETDYPVTLSCFFGKDRSAIASALILAALGVEKAVIVEDFLLYNQNINFNAIVKNADAFNFKIQEAITALYSVHRETIENAFDVIEHNYGSIDNYLEKELHLTNKKREKLRSILLY